MSQSTRSKCEQCRKPISSGKGCRNLRTPRGLFPFCSHECAETNYWNLSLHADPSRSLEPMDARSFIHLHFDWWKRLAPRFRDAWLGMVCHGWT